MDTVFVVVVERWLHPDGAGRSALAFQELAHSWVEVAQMELDGLLMMDLEACPEQDRSLLMELAVEAGKLLGRHSCLGRICSSRHSSFVSDTFPAVAVGSLMRCMKPLRVVFRVAVVSRGKA